MCITNNLHNIAVLDTAEMNYEYSAEEQVTDKNGKTKLQNVNHKNSVKLEFISSSYALAPKTRKAYREFENKMSDQDLNILGLKELKNSLEAYGYDMRQKIDEYGDHQKYVDATTRQRFISDINQVVEWLYSEESKAATR
jgi:hypothetical protein